ncbi:MAG: FAD-dependent oxidoreductase [Victivallaceae bacterium]|nr:FAD-dependent oxidoreductase [Victivallaceae bacterium]
MRVIVVGGGVAGWEAAFAASENAEQVILFCGEPCFPYRRPMLSKLAGSSALPEEGFFLGSAGNLPKNLQLRTTSVVSGIDRRKQCVILSTGEEFAYDKLILAVGASAWTPPFDNRAPGRVIAFREYADLRHLQAHLKEGVSHLLLLGGGVLSLELAQALLPLVEHVSVVENAERLLPRNLSTAGSEFVLRRLDRRDGLSFFFSSQLVSFDGQQAVLSDGTEVPAELMIVSCGMRPRLELAQQAMLPCGRGIKVDCSLRTEDSNLYACGDCAEVQGRVTGLYADAKRSGALAGRNAVTGDEAEKFCFRPGEMRMNALGVKLLSAGSVDGMETALEGDGAENFRKLYCKGERKEGLTLIGDWSGSAALLAGLDR